MLRPDEIVPQADRLFAGQNDDFTGTLGKSFEHNSLLAVNALILRRATPTRPASGTPR